MTAEGPKTLDQIVRTLLTRHDKQWVFHPSPELQDVDVQQILKIFNLMAINVQTRSLTHQTLHVLYCPVKGILYDLIKYFRLLCQFFCDHESFVKLKWTYISNAREKTTKILQPFGCQANIDSFQTIKYFCRATPSAHSFARRHEETDDQICLS